MATSGTVQNFTSLKYILAHMGGAFPSVQDRAFDRGDQEAYDELQDILNTRYQRRTQIFRLVLMSP